MHTHRYPIGTPAIVAVVLARPLPIGLPLAMKDVATWEALAPVVAVPVRSGAPVYEVA